MGDKNLSILIVGGGLAGLTSAIALARQGHTIYLWERQALIGRKVCGEYLSPLGVEYVKQLKLTDIFADYSCVIGMNLSAPNGCLVETNFPSGEGLSLNRQKLEQDLWHMAESLGVNLNYAQAIRSIEKTSTGWLVNGISGDLLIGADGKQSVVAKHLGLHLEVKQKRIALHFYLARKRNFQRRGEMIILDGGSYIGINPINLYEDNVSWVGDSETLKRLGGKENLIKEILRHPRMQSLYGSEATIEKIHSVAQVSHQVRDVITERAALIGDAAGFLDPLTGEGMTRAFESSLFLSEALASLPLEAALKDYALKKSRINKDKNLLNKIFQKIIRSTFVSNFIAALLANDRRRADIFIGIIGNVYAPKEGLKLLITPTREYRAKGESV